MPNISIIEKREDIAPSLSGTVVITNAQEAWLDQVLDAATPFTKIFFVGTCSASLDLDLYWSIHYKNLELSFVASIAEATNALSSGTAK